MRNRNASFISNFSKIGSTSYECYLNLAALPKQRKEFAIEVRVSGQVRRRAVTELRGAVVLGPGATDVAGFDATSLPLLADAIFAGALVPTGGDDLASDSRGAHARAYRERRSDHCDHSLNLERKAIAGALVSPCENINSRKKCKLFSAWLVLTFILTACENFSDPSFFGPDCNALPNCSFVCLVSFYCFSIRRHT